MITKRPCLFTVARICGVRLPPEGRHGDCPFREHKRRKPFSIYRGNNGELAWKCFSCDPPDNGGDAIAFYARFHKLTNREAFKALLSMGEIETGKTVAPSPPPPPKPIPIEGRKGDGAPLSPALFERWKKNDPYPVVEFAEGRGLDSTVLLAHDVVAISRDSIAFVYRDPVSFLPVRAKIRRLYTKAFRVEPRGRAPAPLYLAHMLTEELAAVLITEGEADALAMKQLGYRNVVSLPDGSDSAATVDLSPLVARGSHGRDVDVLPIVWVAAVDDDPGGDNAYAALRKRRVSCGASAIRIRFQKYTDGMVRAKDANEALQRGFSKDDIDHIINDTSERALGKPIKVF